MKYLLLILLSFNVVANEYSIEYAQNKTQMEWKGVSHAKYDYLLKTIGLVVFNDEGYGLRVAYGRGRATLPQQGAKHPDLVIELKSAIDLELLYRHTLYGDTKAYWGIGYYWDHFPITSISSDFYKDDWDNGVGWMVGLEHKMSNHSSVQATFRRRNIIGPAKSFTGALGSSHMSMGVSIRYIF